MKSLNLPKWTFIPLFFLLTIFFSCKKTEVNTEIPKIKSNKTIKEIAFSGSLDVTKTITQTGNDKLTHRYLIPIKNNNKNFYKYLLLENNSKNESQIRSYVISKYPLNNSVDLFTISINKDGVTAYDVNKKKGISSKLLLKHDNIELNINSPIGSNENITPNYAYPGEGEVGYCVDHWWVVSDTETGAIVSIEFLGFDCYGCMQTNSCSGNGGGGGGGGATPVDSAALLSAILVEYNGIHDGEFFMLTPQTVYVPTWTTTAAPLTSTINWPVVNAEYYKVNAKTVTKSAIKPTTFMSGKAINVIECNTVSSLFEMKKSSIFWKVKWEQGNLPPGIIQMNGTPSAEAECNVDGYINIEGRSSWLEIMNGMPNITSESTLRIFYRAALPAS